MKRSEKVQAVIDSLNEIKGEQPKEKEFVIIPKERKIKVSLFDFLTTEQKEKINAYNRQFVDRRNNNCSWHGLKEMRKIVQSYPIVKK